jgi:uncharacterized protein YjbI with pentapeptide repeats
VTVGVVVTVTLWGRSTTEHRDAFDVGWKSAAAVLAALATFVAVERLRLGQREHHRQVLADRSKQQADLAAQITDLSSKASEQLGSEKPAVRIGGLTDLERLAQSYPELRQTVVDRICAYLRAPYFPPSDKFSKRSMRVLHSTSDAPHSGIEYVDDSEKPSPIRTDQEVVEARLELDVRRTAQQILQRHLHWSRETEEPEDYWGPIKLDLRDAALVEVNFSNCRIDMADFRDATFYGYTLFSSTQFTGGSWFDGAHFVNVTYFHDSIFQSSASFASVRFWHSTFFNDAHFADRASFRSANFDSRVEFKKADFAQEAVFASAVFRSVGFFHEVTFGGAADFTHVKLGAAAQFPAVKFIDSVRFDMANFSGGANFDQVQFQGQTRFWCAIFEESAGFNGSKFDERPDFRKVQFRGFVRLEDAVFYKGCDLEDVFVESSPKSRPCLAEAPEWVARQKGISSLLEKIEPTPLRGGLRASIARFRAATSARRHPVDDTY